ncbi:hypothetical protein ABZ752_09465 [Streptomyces roseifaciens]
MVERGVHAVHGVDPVGDGVDRVTLIGRCRRARTERGAADDPAQRRYQRRHHARACAMSKVSGQERHSFTSVPLPGTP